MGRADVARALPRRPARGVARSRRRPRGPVRDQGGRRAGVRLRAAADAAAPARRAGAARRARATARPRSRTMLDTTEAVGEQRAAARAGGGGRAAPRADARRCRATPRERELLGALHGRLRARRHRHGGLAAHRRRVDPHAAGAARVPGPPHAIHEFFTSRPAVAARAWPQARGGAGQTAQPAFAYYLPDPHADVVARGRAARAHARGRSRSPRSRASATWACCRTSGCRARCRSDRGVGILARCPTRPCSTPPPTASPRSR